MITETTSRSPPLNTGTRLQRCSILSSKLILFTVVSILEDRGPSLRRSWLWAIIYSGSDVDRVLGVTLGSNNERRFRKTRLGQTTNMRGVRQPVSSGSLRFGKYCVFIPQEREEGLGHSYVKEDR